RVRHCCDAVLLSISAYRRRYIDYSVLFIACRGTVQTLEAKRQNVQPEMHTMWFWIFVKLQP
ncbi:MAG TPA: hypothetical protein VFQ43_15460, partial [Nitrososphaera sp.]|nr:hypothetical protein [Nitrososphaera sp.]